MQPWQFLFPVSIHKSIKNAPNPEKLLKQWKSELKQERKWEVKYPPSSKWGTFFLFIFMYVQLLLISSFKWLYEWMSSYQLWFIYFESECCRLLSWGSTFLCINFMLLQQLTTLNLHNRDNQHSTLMWSFIRGLKLASFVLGGLR